MDHTVSFALTQLLKAPDAGIVPEGTMADDAAVGAVLVGQRSNLPGEETAGARLRIEALEAEEATQEAPTMVREPPGQQPWPRSSSERRGSQPQVTRQAELLITGKPK